MLKDSDLKPYIVFVYPPNMEKLRQIQQHLTSGIKVNAALIILIQSQPVFALSPYCCMLSREVTNTKLIVFGFTRSGL
jgi:hypothetical protein